MDWVRPPHSRPIDSYDMDALKAEIERIDAKSVLEFGPGYTTQIFLELGIKRIVTCEHMEKWLEVAKERFAGDDRVRVISYTNTVPVEADLGGEKFDIALVDSPQGFASARVSHPGMEDCSRLNTCLFALEHAKVVLLHDADRPLERGTLGRLNASGYHFEFVKRSGIGMARIEKRELHDDRPNTQDAPELGGSADGANPE